MIDSKRVLIAVSAALVMILWGLLPGFARDTRVIHFIALAQVADGAAKRYAAFLSAVEPIWTRYGMTLLTRFPSGIADGECSYDVAILRVESRTGFNAYLRDPDYRAIRDQRLDAVDMLVIFDGFGDPTLWPDGNVRSLDFSTTPSEVDQSTSAKNRFVLAIDVVGVVKGEPPAWSRDVRSILVRTTATDEVQNGLATLVSCQSQ